MIIIGSNRSLCQSDGDSSAGVKKASSLAGRRAAKKSTLDEVDVEPEPTAEAADSPVKAKRGRKPSLPAPQANTAGESDQLPSGENMSVHSSIENQESSFEAAASTQHLANKFVANEFVANEYAPMQNQDTSAADHQAAHQASLKAQASGHNHADEDESSRYQEVDFNSSQDGNGNGNYSDDDEDMDDESGEFQLAANQILLTFSYSLVSQIRQTARMEGVTPEDIITELVAEGCTKRAFQDAQRPVPSHLMTRTGYVPPDPNGNVAQPSMSHHGQQAQGPGRGNQQGGQQNNQRRFNNNVPGNNFGNNNRGGNGGNGGGNRFNNNRNGQGARPPNQGGQNFRGNNQGNGGYNNGGRPFRQNDRGGMSQPQHNSQYNPQAANPNVGAGMSGSTEPQGPNEGGDLRGFARKQNREQKR